MQKIRPIVAGKVQRDCFPKNNANYTDTRKDRLFGFLIIPLQMHCKKRFAVFPSHGRMSLTKLPPPPPPAGNNLIIPGQGEFGK